MNGARGADDRYATRGTIEALAGFLALALAMGVGRFAYTPMLPPMLDGSSLSLAGAGLVASANFAGYLAGALLATRSFIARRRVFWLRVGIVALVVTTAAMAIDAGPWAWSFVRFVAGVASAFVLVFASAVVFASAAREGRPMLGALLYAGVGFGIVASTVLIDFGRDAGWGFAPLWSSLAALALLLAIAPWRELDAPPSSAMPGTAARDERSASADRRALDRLVASYGCLGFGYVITATFVVVMARALPDARTAEFWTWTIVGIAGAPSNWFWARVAQRVGVYRAIVAAFVLEAIGVALVAIGQQAIALYVGAALLGGTFMAITALGLAQARSLAPDRPDETIARMTVAFSIGQIVGPAIGGWMAERSGSFVAPSWIAAAVLVVGAALAAAAGRTGQANGTG
ncbi:MAG: YbfB/YjiJ family MFS transporter [Burkholderiaceae bacterium]|nr:YbfB/YjiJ family MFS transporter [Burkholderiaceae bacterium]